MEGLKKIIATIIKFRIAIIAVLAIAMGLSGYHTITKLSVNKLSIKPIADNINA